MQVGGPKHGGMTLAGHFNTFFRNILGRDIFGDLHESRYLTSREKYLISLHEYYEGWFDDSIIIQWNKHGCHIEKVYIPEEKREDFIATVKTLHDDGHDWYLERLFDSSGKFWDYNLYLDGIMPRPKRKDKPNPKPK